MSGHETFEQPVDTAAITNELMRLDRVEVEISRRRADLHRRIDRVYLRSPFNEEDTALLDELERQELQISHDRRILHDEIDMLRAQIGLPRWREASDEFDLC